MSIYQITYTLQLRRLMPPIKRLPKYIAWLTALFKPWGWLSDLSLDSYRIGTTVAAWDAGIAYGVYERVRWTDGSIYECIVATSAGEKPVGPYASKWYKVLDSFIGVEERVLFNGQKTVLEYALNKYMGTNFVQPVYSPPSANSDIYIDNLLTDDNSFLVGEESPETSFVPLYSSLSEDFVGYSFSSAAAENFAVYYPVAFTTAQLNQVKALTEKYKLYGTTPVYITY